MAVLNPHDGTVKNKLKALSMIFRAKMKREASTVLYMPVDESHASSFHLFSCFLIPVSAYTHRVRLYDKTQQHKKTSVPSNFLYCISKL